MENEEKAKEIVKKASCLPNLTEYEAMEYVAIKMAKWKDEQHQIDKAHLDMIYEALDRLYKVRYGDEPIIYTGSQTDVFLYMIEDIINDTKSK